MALEGEKAGVERQLHAKFYIREHDPYKDQTFFRCITPGDSTQIWDQPVRDIDKMRFPREWLIFQGEQGADQIVGTPLSLWHQERPDEFTEGQLAELITLKFQSVDQMAGASDAQVMRIGMGGPGLRTRAKAYLSSKNAQASGAELEQAKNAIAEMRAEMAAMRALMAAPVKEPRAKIAKPVRKYRKQGRPRKDKGSADADAATGTVSSQ